ncbi:hypothetical protein [Alkalihalobacillus pseudalcaliphilus]|uniref:hypothetical protein n=1 Tax=Alkalihalobacillus pseudalcaliphilus TaxID=79884 RepID=UPI00064DE81F|nr:hypothetical protein [Alkalihalobacillus pseudalcaliphilus]KMK76127.1 hypothetical protein AB990_12940 [Alkalihalobacillus pseudalcaliphilus]
MNTWLHLIKKEFHLGKGMLYGAMIATIIITSLSYILTESYFGIGLSHVSMTALFLMAFHILFLLGYFYHSMQKENLHVWLHNTLPGYALLGAKLVAGLISMFISLLFTSLFIFIPILLGLVELPLNEIFALNVTQIMAMFLFMLFQFTISMTIVLLFFYILYLLFKKYLKPTLSFIVSAVLFVTSMYFYGELTETAFFQTLTQWGYVSQTIQFGEFNFSFDQTGLEMSGANTEVSLYVGDFVIQGILLIILFATSSWILDRKLEV